jgi:hypothetical protein
MHFWPRLPWVLAQNFECSPSLEDIANQRIDLFERPGNFFWPSDALAKVRKPLNIPENIIKNMEACIYVFF